MKPITFPTWAPHLHQMYDLHKVNFGNSTLCINFTTQDDEYGKNDALIKIESYIENSTLFSFTHLARKLAAPLAGLLTSSIPENFLTRLGLANNEAKGHNCLVKRSGLAHRLEFAPAIISELIKNNRLGKVQARFNGQQFSLEDAIIKAHQGAATFESGTRIFQNRLKIQSLLELSVEFLEKKFNSQQRVYPGKMMMSSLLPGYFESFVTYNDDGFIVDYLLLHKDSSMTDLASSMSMWTPVFNGAELNHSFLSISNSNLEYDVDQRQPMIEDFVRASGMGFSTHHYLNKENEVIIGGPSDEVTMVYFACNDHGQTVGARIQFGAPTLEHLHLLAQTVAQVEARHLMNDLNNGSSPHDFKTKTRM